MTTPTESRDLLEYIDRSPSPFHACAEARVRLEAAGFRQLEEESAWSDPAGRWFVLRGGTLVAWAVPPGGPARRASAGFRIAGAHTDSPNLRIKPRPDSSLAGCRKLGVEVYGSPLLSSWLDRDLGLSGRVFVRGDSGPEPVLFLLGRPLLRIPQLAIHLNREVNTAGLILNPQKHLEPVWATRDGRDGSPAGFVEMLASELDLAPDAILSWDAMCHDVTPSTLLGCDEEFVSAPRLDNLFSCFAAVRAIEACLAAGGEQEHVPVVCLFDHEEVGSASSRGAAGPILRDVLERTVLARDGSREDYHRALAASVCVSIDMAHATHPNYPERHEPNHFLRMNRGPVVKINASQRYASEAQTEAAFQVSCEEADVPVQKWVNRSDLACGSTIGPITAARLGIRTVDVGCAQLAMHSAREMCGSHDLPLLIRALTSFLA